MAVVLKGLSRVGSSVDEQGVRQYRRTYRVRASAPPETDAEAEIVAAIGADLGEPFAADPGAICISIDLACDERKGVGTVPYWDWQANLVWSTKQKRSEPTNNPNPLARPIVISMDTIIAEEPTWKDVAGNAVTNSAEDPVPRPKKRGKVVFRYEKNVASIDWRLLKEPPQGLLLTRNSAPFNPWGPFSAVFGTAEIETGKGRIEKLSATAAFENGIAYAAVKMEVATDEDSFEDIFVDQGFFYLAPGKDGIVVSKQFLDEQGQWATTPQLLDGEGGPSDIPFDREYQYYPVAAWTPLGII